VRRSDAIIHWLAALVISSAAVSAYIFIVEVVTTPFSREMMDITFSLEGAANFAVGLLKSTGVFTLFVFPISLLPALIVSGAWELSGRRPSAVLYAIGGLITGLAFAMLIILNSPNTSERIFLDLALTAGSAGLVGGWVMAWRRRVYFRVH
jgi:hypothetical protein